MAISNNYQPTFDLGNGVTTNFSAPWRVLDLDYLVVIFQNVLTGVQTVQTTGFTAQILSNGSVQVSFSVAPPSSNYVILARNITIDQGDPYTTAKGLQGFTLEGSLDKLTGIDQDQQDAIDRSLKFAVGSIAIGALPLPVDQAVLTWSGTGGTLVNGPTVGQISAAAGYAATAQAASTTATTQAGISTTQAGIAVAAAASTKNFYCSVGGTANALTLTSGQSLTAYTTGMKFRFTPSSNSSATTPTIAVDTAGAVTLVKSTGTALGALVAGDLAAGVGAEVDMISPTVAMLMNPQSIYLGASQTGEFFWWPGTSAPAYALQLPTTATNVSRTTYAKLFAKIGTTWGVGDGSTTFGIPFLPAGYTAMSGTPGSANSVGQVISHFHTFGAFQATGGGSLAASAVASSPVTPVTDPTGGTANLAAGAQMMPCIRIT